MSIDINASRAICDAATPGPWECYGTDLDGGGSLIRSDAERPGVPAWWSVLASVGSRNDQHHKANAALIAHSRTALPAALDEIERLRAFRASLGAWMESYEDEAQSFLASSGLAPHVHAFHRGRVKAMEDLICFLDAPGGEG